MKITAQIHTISTDQLSELDSIEFYTALKPFRANKSKIELYAFVWVSCRR